METNQLIFTANQWNVIYKLVTVVVNGLINNSDPLLFSELLAFFKNTRFRFYQKTIFMPGASIFVT